jgi:hypothetical protein
LKYGSPASSLNLENKSPLQLFIEAGNLDAVRCLLGCTKMIVTLNDIALAAVCGEKEIQQHLKLYYRAPASSGSILAKCKQNLRKHTISIGEALTNNHYSSMHA